MAPYLSSHEPRLRPDAAHRGGDHLVIQPVLGQQPGARLFAAGRLAALRAQQPAHVEHRARQWMRDRAPLREFVGSQAHVETRAAARLDQAGGDQAVVGLDHGRAADARFLRAVADGGQPRAGTQRVRFDALREARGELCGQAVILLCFQCHI